MRPQLQHFIASFAWVAVYATACCGQTVNDRELLTGRPFDLVVLKQGERHKSIPLPFAGREVPSPLPEGVLRLRLIDRPGTGYEVPWNDVREIILFEQQLLERAQTLSNDKQFNQAFLFFARLHKDYSDYPGLAEATEKYLIANADHAFRNREYDLAVALLLSLNERYPDSPTLSRAVDAVAEKLIESRVADRDFRAARGQLTLLEQGFENLDLSVVKKWQVRFRTAADSKSAEASRLLERGDFRGARAAISQAVLVWPTHEESRRLLAEIERLYPRVIVGVTTPSLAIETHQAVRLDAPAAMRTAPLVAPTLTQLVDYGSEGGLYACPLGDVSLDNTARYLEFSVGRGQAPFTLARWLAHVTDPQHPLIDTTLAGVLSSVRVDSPDRVRITLSRSFVRPESLFKEVPLAAVGVRLPSTYKLIQQDNERLVAQVPATGNAQSSTIEEQVFDGDSAAIAALSSGEVDMVANLPPWQLNSLRKKRGIIVERYRLPTVHGIIPTKRHPLLNEREFRRALLYGINRKRILEEVLLAGKEEEGYVLISGPFPFGVDLGDPVRYAYNDEIEPRPFDPRLSLILSSVAWDRVQNKDKPKGEQEKQEEDPAEEQVPLPLLTLAHTSDPLARTACQAIQLQLSGIGFEIDLLEVTEAELLADDPPFDLRYAELAMWEPVVDAQRLLGPGGLAGRCSDPMRAALSGLYKARNTKEVRLALFEVHRIAHGDLPFLPLWQTSKHFAYREGLTGVPASPVRLYADAARWRKEVPSR